MNNLFLNQLSIGEFLAYYSKLSENELIKMVQDGSLENVNDDIFRMFFLRSSNKIKLMILDNANLFEKVIKISPSKSGKTVFELVDNCIIEKIINSKEAILYIKEIIEYCKVVNDNILDIIINSINKDNFELGNEILSIINDYLKTKFNCDSYIIDLFNNSVKNGVNPLYALRIRNEIELFILAKFGLVVHVKDTCGDEILLSNNKCYSYSLLKKISTKKINTISK